MFLFSADDGRRWENNEFSLFFFVMFNLITQFTNTQWYWIFGLKPQNTKVDDDENTMMTMEYCVRFDFTLND